MKARIPGALNTLLTAAPILALWHSLTAGDLSSAEEFTAFLLGFAAAVPLFLVAASWKLTTTTFQEAHHESVYNADRLLAHRLTNPSSARC
jgi:hypothetical protein